MGVPATWPGSPLLLALALDGNSDRLLEIELQRPLVLGSEGFHPTHTLRILCNPATTLTFLNIFSVLTVAIRVATQLLNGCRLQIRWDRLQPVVQPITILNI